ncbi:MAG TPA: hypothetical protein VHW24_12960 [Bryobacteraceae bacterium]|nr:hypothetical protein [Bryobacteraceae bacterium]
MHQIVLRVFSALSLAASLPVVSLAQPVAVRHPQGSLHGFLSLTSEGGLPIATGDLDQTVRGGNITSHLVFRFKDGSVQDETTVFSQRKIFHLISEHLIQKGPSFPRQLDLTVNGTTGTATAIYSEKGGKEKTETTQLHLPNDLANGLVPTLLQNLAPGAALTASMVVAAPKPQIVKLAIQPDGSDEFVLGGQARTATRYLVKVEIGGIKGVVAPLVGKQPPDTKVWIMGGVAPAYLRSEGASCEGCAIWVTELASPRLETQTSHPAERKK